jgi:hypothetical protein
VEAVVRGRKHKLLLLLVVLMVLVLLLLPRLHLCPG